MVPNHWKWIGNVPDTEAVEKYLMTLKRRVVMLNDQYRYDEVISMANEILEYEMELSDLWKLLVESESGVYSISNGRALSQCSQK